MRQIRLYPSINFRFSRRSAFRAGILVLFIMLFAVQQAWSAWYDPYWRYRKSHVINSAAGTGTGYQVKVTVYYAAGTDSAGSVYVGGLCNTDFSDIRFTASDGTTALDHWMESSTVSNNAVFWVELTDNISAASSTIYVYYGNSIATTASNGPNTFLFFDDFSVDLSKWTVDPLNTDRVAISAGALRHDPDATGRANSDTRATTTTFTMTDGALAYKVYLGGPTNRKIHQMGWRVNSNALTSGYAWRLQNSAADGGFFRYNAGAWAQIGTAYALVAANTWWNVEVKVVGSNFETFINGTSVKTVTDATTAGPAALNTHVHGVGLVLNTDYVLVDDIRVRKVVTTEPTHGSWGTQELNPARRKMMYY
jgi:hypothetical protein